MLGDGSPGSRRVARRVVDLARSGEVERLRAELWAQASREPGGQEAGIGREATGHDTEGSHDRAGQRQGAGAGLAHDHPADGGGGPAAAASGGCSMREAVVEVVGHLVLKAVPPAERSPLFDQAQDLLTEAGWGLDELFEAAHDGPARHDLFRVLGLEE